MAAKAVETKSGKRRKRLPYSDLIVLFFLYGKGHKHCGYTMKQIIRDTQINRWLPISSMTVYQSMRRLEEAGYITGIAEKPGSYPERVMYSITAAGRKHFEKTLRDEMQTSIREYFHFDIGIGLGSYMPLDDKIAAARDRIRQLEAEFAKVDQEIEDYGSSYHSPFPRWLLLDHERHFLASEIAWLKRYIGLVRDDENSRKMVQKR